MTADEFNALKIGDKIQNGDGDTAEVVTVSPHGKHIRWGSNPEAPTFFLYYRGTSWYGLEVVNAAST